MDGTMAATKIWSTRLIIPLSTHIVIPCLHPAVCTRAIIGLATCPIQVIWRLLTSLPNPCSFLSRVRESNPIEDILVEKCVYRFLLFQGSKFRQVSSVDWAVLTQHINEIQMLGWDYCLQLLPRSMSCVLRTLCNSESGWILWRSIHLGNLSQLKPGRLWSKLTIDIPHLTVYCMCVMFRIYTFSCLSWWWFDGIRFFLIRSERSSVDKH